MYRRHISGKEVLSNLNILNKVVSGMVDEGYTVTFLVDQTPEEAFDAINNVRGWWSENIDGITDKVGEEWTYRAEGFHYCKMKVTELVPGKKVSWKVLDNRFTSKFGFKDKTEWIGTRITFDISRKGNKTEVRFVHVGLVPEYECYNLCSNAWGSYVRNSLRDLITKGKGQPNPKEKSRKWE